MNRPLFPMRSAVLAAALVLTGSQVLAQSPTISFNPRTGDVWVDTRLNDINRYGGTYRDSFINEMVRYHAAPRDLVGELLNRPNWTPGDVYYACALAAQTGRPCRSVADGYDRDRGQGWGAIAQRMGIKPGSPQFHALKRGFVPTYDRWGRPVRIDRDLAGDFPNRGEGMRHEGRGHREVREYRVEREHGHGRGDMEPMHGGKHGRGYSMGHGHDRADRPMRQESGMKHGGGNGNGKGNGNGGGHGKH